MKCSGPSTIPCTRCQRAGADCVFSPSHGKARDFALAQTIQQVQQHIQRIEDRCGQESRYTLETNKRMEDLERAYSSRLAPSTRSTEEASYWCLRRCAVRSDIIDEGIIALDYAERLIEVCQQHMAEQLSWFPPLPRMDIMRSQSPLLVAVACAVGAQIGQAHEVYQACLYTAGYQLVDALSPRMFTQSNKQRPSYLDILGAMLYYLVTGQQRADLAAIASLAEYLQLSESLDVLNARGLTVSRAVKEALLDVARVYVSLWQYCVVMSVVKGVPCPLKLAESGQAQLAVHVLTHHDAARTAWDFRTADGIQWCSIIERASTELSLSNMDRNLDDDGFEAIEDFLAEVRSWSQASDLHRPRSAHASDTGSLLLLGLGTVLVCAFHDEADLQNVDPAETARMPSCQRVAAEGVRHGASLVNIVFSMIDGQPVLVWKDAALVASTIGRRMMEWCDILMCAPGYVHIFDEGFHCLSQVHTWLENRNDSEILPILRNEVGGWLERKRLDQLDQLSNRRSHPSAPLRMHYA